MATIIGGNGTGTLDSSLYLLNRNDTTGTGTAGHDEQAYINVSNGNLILGHLDAFLPSETNNFLSVRTYNSRAQFVTPNGEGWTLTEFSRLSVTGFGQISVLNGDGSQFTFNYDASSGVYRSVDGSGPYETISFDARTGNYSLVQSNQTVLTYDFTGTLLQSKDTNGNTISYSYDLFGNLSSIRDNSGHRLSFIYQFGNLVRIQDETGTVFASYTYFGNRLVSATDRGGETTSYAYNLDGTLRSVTLPSGPGEATRTLQFTYAAGPGGPVISSFTDAQGAVTRFNYNFTRDFLGRVTGGTTSVIDALGHVTAYTFDSKGEITNVRDALQRDTVYGYDANKNLTSVMDVNGSAIVRSDSDYFRNLRRDLGIVEAATGQGKLVAELTAADVTALQAHFTTHLAYDSKGNLTSRLDGSGNRTTYTYTSFNKVASATTANRNTTVYTYDSKQNLTQIKADNGDLTQLSYDALGNLTQKTVYLDPTNPAKQETTKYFYDLFGNNVKTIDAQGSVTLTTYDHFGNPVSQVDGRGGVTSYTYDAENRLRSTTDPLGNTTLNFYDAVGNRVAVRDSSSHTVTYLYNADNLLIAVIDPSADLSQAATRTRTTQYSYDVVGNRTSTTDAEGHTTTYTYDVLNRLVTTKTPTVVDAAGKAVSYTTTYGYDAVGNRITVIDNDGNRTDTVYNSNNLVRRVTDASGHITEYAYDADLNQVSIVIGAELAVASRQVLRFAYDQRDRLTGTTDALGKTTHYSYDGANNKVAVTDANNNTTDYSYDADNRLLTVTRPAVLDPATGQSVRYTVQYQYDANGNQVAITDENCQTVRTSFDKDDRAVLLQDAAGFKTVYTYDSRGNRTSIQIGVQAHLDSSGRVVVDSTQGAQVETYAYDEFNQVIAATDGVGNALVSSDSSLYVQMRKQLGIVDASGQGKQVAQLTAADIQALKAQYTERYTYDRLGNHTSTTDHLGHNTSVTYDGLNRVVGTTDALGQQTKSAYDGNGNMLVRTDALGRQTRYSYDSLNRLTDTTDALGFVTHRAYDSFGNVSSVTAAYNTPTDARTVHYLYDLDNRLSTTIDAEGNSQSYAYDAVGNRLRVTDGRGKVTQYVYDALNHNVSIIDPIGFQVRFIYDGVGNKLSVVDAKGGITKFTYDGRNREIQMQDAEGRLTTFQYDAQGNRVSQTTAAGTTAQETTTYEYDAENNLTKITDAAKNITTKDYDAAYNVTRTTDANGHITEYAFDALNREIQVTDAARGVTIYQYDAVGNRLKVIDANRHTTSYTYDARNQEIRVRDAQGIDTVYAYDAVGNQQSVTHAANTAAAAKTSFTYDLDNRLIAQTDALGNTQKFKYDENGNVTSTTDALNHTTKYEYDDNSRVKKITDPLLNVIQYAYDGNGNRVQVIDARGFTTTTYYGADDEILLSVDNSGYATGFTYDQNGNIQSETRYAKPLTLPVDPAVLPTPVSDGADRTTLFKYDVRNRLIAQTDGEGFVTKYVYDAVGNRTQVQRALDVAGTQFEVTRSYYDAVNREVARLSPQGYLSTFQYDPVGNCTTHTQYDQIVSPSPDGSVPTPVAGDTGRITRFAYDYDNRLLSTTNALGVVTAYQYDYRGNRTSMTIASGTTQAQTTAYTYDAADRLTDIKNALGVVTHLDLDANGNVTTRHEAYQTADERVYNYSYDARNRLTEQSDALGVFTETEYDAVGNVVRVTVAVNTPDARTSKFSYDADGRQTQAMDAAGDITAYAYDAEGEKIGVTEAPGSTDSRSNSFTYDRAGRLVSATDALGTVTRYRYDGAGNKLETIQAVGTPQERHTFYTYDLSNRIVQVKDPMGAVTKYDYDAQGNQTRVVDANGGVQINTFDALGRALRTQSAAGILTQNSYDLRGNLVSTTQSFLNGSDSRTSTYSYDALDRQTLVTNGEGFSTSLEYDAFGNQTAIIRGLYLVSQSDPAYSSAKAALAVPQKTQFQYDADDRLKSMTDALSNVNLYTYDRVGNRTSTTDPNGNTSRYEYDKLNRVVKAVTPEGGVTLFTYNAVGNKTAEDQLQSGSEANGVWRHTSFQYDANGNLTTQTDPLGTVTRYSYDAMGNLLSRTSAAGTSDARTVQMEYDLDNQKIADIDALGNRTTYAYDAVGNRIKVSDPLGHVAHYFYDAANRLQEVVDPQGYVNTFTYDSAGNRTQSRVYMTALSGPIDDRTAPAPVASSQDRVTSWQYDLANRKTRETAADGSITQYSYDAVGNKVAEKQFANTSAPRTLSYVYDADDRLVRFTDVDGSVTSFTYDQANNKLSQTISSATDPNHTRTATFLYDRNNRELSETFDPTGLAIVQSYAYDQLGNVVSKTDGDGHTSIFAYDLDNREVSQTDALGHTATKAYDRVGNVIARTDARGNTTRYEYDAANRLVKETKPQVLTYTISGGFKYVQPTTTHVYDANGNEIQTTDANGGVTTRYYDGDARLVGQISADNVLTTYTYDATGARVSQTLYMTRLTADAQDPSAPPRAPGGNSQPITYSYDLIGRLTQVTYPPTQITTLINTNTANPSSTTITQQVTERYVYDAFGNVVENYDRNGNRTLSYYDVKGQKIASVDATGYLTQWDYDEQGNILEQRLYTKPLDTSTLSPGTLPVPADGTKVYVTDVQYDAASRKIREIAPQISVFDPNTQTTSSIRPTTTYTYDSAGNQLTRTLGAGTTQAITEYSYYDADNRRVAVIDSSRVLVTYTYDAIGNVVAQRRYFNPVDPSVDLSQLSGATDFTSLVSADDAKDEETDFTFDALNRQTGKSDLVGASTLTKLTEYDALSNVTWAEDEGFYITRASYDAVGRIVQSISPDLSGTQYQYDAAGNRVLIYTGVLVGGAPTPATDLSASLGGQVKLTWNTQGNSQSPLQTWVVYDTVSHQNLSDYANRTSTQVSTNGKGQAALNPGGTGATVYFRVVTRDGAGNETWTAEQSLTVPPRLNAVSVAQPDASTIVVTAHFDPGAARPQIVYGTAGNLNQTAAFVQQSDGSYQATLSGLASPGALSFALQWQDAGGNQYSSSTGTFAAVADQVGVTTAVNQAQIVNGANTTYTLALGTRVPSAYAGGLTLMQAQWRVAGSGNAYAKTAVKGVSSGQGYQTFDAVLGESSNLSPGTYEIVLTGIRADGSSVELDHFSFAVGPAATSVTRSAVSWIAPAVGNDQLVIIDGQSAPASRDSGRVVASDGSSASSADYAAYYGQDFTDKHTVTVSSTAVTQSTPDPDPNKPPHVVVTGYDVGVQATVSAGEAANISGGLHLAWRPAGSGTSFSNDVVLSSSGTDTFATTLSNIPAGQYDLKLYYLDPQGHEVIVEWRRIDAVAAATSPSIYTGYSLTVLAKESGGAITTDAQGVLTLSPGVYTGALDVNALSGAVGLSLTGTGSAGGSLKTDGRSTGYFTEIQYNALNDKIASNEGDGLWREYGVDGNGNAVQTDLLGDRGNPDYDPSKAITTYTAFDARNRKIAEFGAPVAVAGGSTLVRPVTRDEYNVLDKVIAHTDALGKTTAYEFNALGTQISQTDAYGQTTQTLVDQFGNTTAQITPLLHRTVKFYDLQGRLIKEVGAAGATTTYTYDVFGRMVTRTDGRKNTTKYTYDQRDRLISQTDPLGNAETFAYDGRNHRISTHYPLGEQTDQAYDSLGRVIDTQVYLGKQPTHSLSAYDAYGNLISETDAEGRSKTHVYGAFGRLLEDIDEDGNIIAYSYDVYGRQTNQYDPNAVTDPNDSSDPSGGKDIQSTYDAAGRLTSIRDLSTGVSTTYTYDLAGHRLEEVITTPGNAHNRDVSYEYDALGQLVRWKDAVTGDNLNTWYDSEGNVAREFTDTGYDPIGQNTGANPNYRYIDHLYTYDASRRVISEVQRTVDDQGVTTDTILNAYKYDAASNRIEWTHDSVVVKYSYDANNRVTEGSYNTGTDVNTQDWTYDAMGNVVRYETGKNGSQVSLTVTTYNSANRNLTSSKDGQVTTQEYDRSLRITRTILTNNGKTYTYDYTYFGDGREKSVTAYGDANGNSASTYDANKIRVRVNLGQGDNQSRPEFKTFVADNEGHILYEFHDDGKSSQDETSEFLYANGNPVGENTRGTDGKLTVQLDTGTYAQVQNISDSNPGANLTYTVRDGDSLQGIASQMYGNPSLWFVIADANGLSATDTLRSGTTLLIPSTVQTGSITANNHKVYSETDIVGSTLPNLKTPPPPHHGGCSSILAIIIIVVIAVVATIATAGIGTAILGGAAAAASASTAATVGAYAAAGLLVGALASIVQQGLFIAINYQKGFDWRKVAFGAAEGALAGAAAGFGQATQLAAAAGKLTPTAATVAKISVAALDVLKAGAEQFLQDGKITSWSGLAAAAVGGFASESEVIAGAEKAAATSADAFEAAETGYNTAKNIARWTDYLSPWVELAEKSIRHQQIKVSDWEEAAGRTLAHGVTDLTQRSDDPLGPKTASDVWNQRLTTGALRLGSRALVAGVASFWDRRDAEQYLYQSIGEEVGGFFIPEIIQGATSLFGMGSGSNAPDAHAARQSNSTQQRPPGQNANSMPSIPQSSGAMHGGPYMDASTFWQAQADAADDTQSESDAGAVSSGSVTDTPPQTDTSDTADGGNGSPDKTGKPPKTHIVKSGETLITILHTHDPTVIGMVMMYNHMDNTELEPGQPLRIPSLGDYDWGDVQAFTMYGKEALGADKILMQAQGADRVIDWPSSREHNTPIYTNQPLNGADNEYHLEAPIVTGQLGPALSSAPLVKTVTQPAQPVVPEPQELDLQPSFPDVPLQPIPLTPPQVQPPSGTNHWWNDVGDWMDRNNVGTRIVGGLQTLGGVLEAEVGAGLIAAGVVTSEFGIGFGLMAAGGALVGMGADQATAGVMKAVTGENQQTFLSQGIQQLGASREKADLADATINGVAGMWGTGWLQSMKPPAMPPPPLTRAAPAAEGAVEAEALTAEEWLVQHGITNPQLRRQIQEAGLRTELLSANTPATLARFNKLFVQTVQEGKRFIGRLGNIATRVATINKSAEIELGGDIPEFEYPVDVAGGKTRYVDLVGIDPDTGLPEQFYQFVKENAAGQVIRPDELVAARQIEQSWHLDPGTVQFINTNGH